MLAEEPVTQENGNIESLKKALTEATERAENNLAGWQRERADFSNYKKRIEQEKADLLNYADAEMIKSILPVVDDMERAFSMVDHKLKSLSWVEGFRQIQRKLQDILRDHGCSEIECLGQPFDPNLHEAVAYEEGDEGAVISEHRKGYRMKEKVLRVAQVTVGKGRPGEDNNNENVPGK
jgi:molecular chaperone GrpE